MSQETIISNLIDMLKVSAGWDREANEISGRLFHKLMDMNSTETISQYMLLFGPLLEPHILEFIQNYEQEIDEVCLEYRASYDFMCLRNCGILPAKRFYDTYVLPPKTENNGKYESIPHFFARIAAYCAWNCIMCESLKDTLVYIQKRDWNVEIKTDMHIFKYFYKVISSQLVCCATPVMRSAGVAGENLSSCFIIAPTLDTEKSTISSIFGELAPLLASRSGVGVDVTKFSFSGKNIHSCLKLINAQVEFFNDKSVRPVSVAAYIEVWHCQIHEFLSAKLPENPDRCNSIFQGVCVPSLFFKMYEVDPNGLWYLFDPKDAPNLVKLYGFEFEEEYLRLVSEKKYKQSVTLKSLMFSLINTIIKTGSPYVISKEAMNKHHWYETQGEAINCSNLCAEIVQQPKQFTSTCNLANVCLPKCLNSSNFPYTCSNTAQFDFSKLEYAVQAAVFIINACILSPSPTSSATVGQRERSMGIGCHGLADVFSEMGYGYLDLESECLDRDIFETMYYTAVKTSSEICSVGKGQPFAGFRKSKLAHGVFHWATWDAMPQRVPMKQWIHLQDNIKKFGVFNSQFIALMPTAGTSQLTGYTDSFYPYFANMSSKVSNKEEIMKPNITFLKNVKPQDLCTVRFYGGDVSMMPEEVSTRYKHFLTAFDYCPEAQMRRASIRAPYVDQSQSLTLFLTEENVQSAKYLKDLLLLGFRLGLKTIMYYCRVKKTTKLLQLECLKLDEHMKKDAQIVVSDLARELLDSHKTEDTCPLDQSECIACQ
uniref:Ribonucleoside-diphosphate reductase large subunit n=1 Tax=Saimiriine herpesvirus 2 (strain 488) TaxID=10384 RepID=Q80BL9_SHV2C|nr:RRlarge [Saimiriine gammaherpesvirus 2]